MRPQNNPIALEESEDKSKQIKLIIEEVFALDNPKINIERKTVIENFVISAINGDDLKSHLVLDANLLNKERGVIVYVITNARLIKIVIGDKELESSIFPLNTLIGLNKNLTNDGRIEFSATFQNGTIGLRYPQEDKKISDFFQKIEHVDTKQ